MPDGVTIPGGPGFAGTPQPPDVPCDPTGEAWRGPMGPPGPQGIPGQPTAGGPFLPLSGGTVTGPTFVNSNLILTPSTITLSGTNTGYQTPIYQQASLAGSFSDGRSFSLFTTSDNAAATGTNAANGYSFLLNYGGSAMKGGRIALNANLVQSAATQNTNVFYQAVNFAATATQPELSGTTPTMTGGSSVFSIGSYATLTPSALGYSQLVGYEQDICVGAQPYSVVGLQIVRLSGGFGTLYQAVEPSLDVAFRIGSVLNAANWINGYTVGSPNSPWPIDPASGTLVKAFPGQSFSINPAKASAGVDFSYVQFSGNAWHSQGALIDGSGVASFTRLNLGNWSATFNASGLTLDTATRQIALSVAVAAAGAGYNINEQFSFAGNGRGIVTTQTGGTVTGVAILEYPTATSPPANPVATTSLMFANAGQGHGTGLTLTLTWSVANALAINPATTLSNGISFGAQVGSGASPNTDLSKHIILHTAGYGISVTSNRLNLVAPPGAALNYTITGGTGDIAIITATGGLRLAQGLGLFNGTPVTAKPTVTGAKGSNAALASLMTALAAYGLVIDTTTA